MTMTKTSRQNLNIFTIIPPQVQQPILTIEAFIGKYCLHTRGSIEEAYHHHVKLETTCSSSSIARKLVERLSKKTTHLLQSGGVRLAKV